MSKHQSNNYAADDINETYLRKLAASAIDIDIEPERQWQVKDTVLKSHDPDQPVPATHSGSHLGTDFVDKMALEPVSGTSIAGQKRKIE